MSQSQSLASIEVIRTLFEQEAKGKPATPDDEKALMGAVLDIAARLLVDIRRIADTSEETLKHIREANTEFGF